VGTLGKHLHSNRTFDSENVINHRCGPNVVHAQACLCKSIQTLRRNVEGSLERVAVILLEQI